MALYISLPIFKSRININNTYSGFKEINKISLNIFRWFIKIFYDKQNNKSYKDNY